MMQNIDIVLYTHNRGIKLYTHLINKNGTDSSHFYSACSDVGYNHSCSGSRVAAEDGTPTGVHRPPHPTR